MGTAPCRGTGRSVTLPLAAWVAAAPGRLPRVGNGFCAMPLALVLANNAVKLNRIPWLNIRAVVRRFLGDRNVMRMVLPHRRSRDADESCIASQLFNRP